jgi:hypothetical protein
MSLLDFITDKNGSGDEKRLLGIVFLIYAGVFAWFHPSEATSIGVIAGIGTGLLLGGVLGDKVSPTLVG